MIEFTSVIDGIKVNVKQIKESEKMGDYKATKIDELKKECDFRLISTSPYCIIWKNGNVEIVNKRKLNKLQKEFTWQTDF